MYICGRVCVDENKKKGLKLCQTEFQQSKFVGFCSMIFYLGSFDRSAVSLYNPFKIILNCYD